MSTILITGTGSGLGKALTEFFAQKGWNVIATSRSPKGHFSKYENVTELKLDVTDLQNIQESVLKNKYLWESTDILINNAGLAVLGALEDTDNTAIQKVFEVNVAGPSNMIKSVLPFFRNKKSGKIINISSLIGLSTDIPLASVYAMSKFALEGLSEGLYYELKALNIDLHLVEPGGFKSSLADNALIFNPEASTVYADIFAGLTKVLEAKSKDENTPHTKIEDVIKTVYRLATNEIDTFRNPVGSDSSEILTLRSQNSNEDYLELISKRF